MIDLDALRKVVERATGWGWEAAYRQDVTALVAEVEQLRAAATVILNNAWEDGAREERQNVTAHLRAVATSPAWTGEGKPLLSTEARLVLILQAANIERGDHCREGDE